MESGIACTGAKKSESVSPGGNSSWRNSHIGARAELEAIGTQILKRVGQLDSFNRERFKNDAERLAGWVSVATVLGLPRPVPLSGDEPTTPPSAAEPAA